MTNFIDRTQEAMLACGSLQYDRNDIKRAEMLGAYWYMLHNIRGAISRHGSFTPTAETLADMDTLLSQFATYDTKDRS